MLKKLLHILNAPSYLPHLIVWGIKVSSLTSILFLTYFSDFFSATFSQWYPEVFSPFGIVIFLLWSCASWLIAEEHHQVRGILIIFALQKFAYTLSWGYWFFYRSATLSEIWTNSATNAIFYAFYGLIEGIMGLFFLWAFVQSKNDALQHLPR